MKSTVTQNGKNITVALEGQLDTKTSPEFNKEIEPYINGDNNVVMDLELLKYVSSAGLRVILLMQKTLAAKGGSLILKNVTPRVYEILEMTGFLSIMNVEK